jgi:hypothetical protein
LPHCSQEFLPMRQRQWIAIAAFVALALGIGYFLGRGAPMPAPSAAPVAPVEATTRESAAQQQPSAARASARAAHAGPAGMPLPLPGTPLAQVFDELKARADAGDLQAASRLERDLRRCARNQRIKRVLPLFVSLALDTDPKNSNTETVQFEDPYLGDLQRKLDEVRNNEILCAELEEAQFAALWPLELQAAHLGDIRALDCYVGNSVSDIPGLLDHPQWLTQYKNNALALAETAIHNGDWVAVDLLHMAYEGIFPDMLLHQLTGYDPVLSYRYVKLQRLGATGEFATNSDKVLRSAAQGLTPQQLADADAWAQDTYTQYFRGSSSNGLSNGANICPNTDG